MLDAKGFDLPPIPAKRYFAIGEVSKLCQVKPHVLRYWEQEFPHLKPVKRRGNRRYYQLHEVKLIRQIRHLLHIEGYTINGARAQLDLTEAIDSRTKSSQSPDSVETNADKESLSQLISDLKEIRKVLE
ncbi:MAG: MerR family transcriptional regulator [Gammaproteobacteria bacterium]|nr:MerR family transcriptional regulator [Gammaproteobacteria bacterium]